MLGLASCQNDPEGFDVTVDGEVSTKVTVNLADASSTRTGGSNLSGIENGALEGDNTIRYILQVFDETGEQSKEKMYAYTDEKTAAFDVRLVPGRTYNFVVWADIVRADHQDWHYNTTDLKNITLNGDWVAMDETRDAYTDVETIENFNSTSSINLTLTRPFAKLRVVTTDMDELMANVQPSKVQVEYTTDYRTGFNALSGAVVEDAYSTIAKSHNTLDIVSYGEDGERKTLFTDYLFAADSDDVVSFVLRAYDANNVLMRETNFNTDIPVKRNYLTTIIGDVLTDGNNVSVTIDPTFAGTETVEVIEVNNAADLQDAIENAADDTETVIEITDDIDISDLFVGLLSTRANNFQAAVTIPAGKDITLVVNNNTVSFSSDYMNGAMIQNNGKLTLEGTGSFVYTYTGDADTAYANGNYAINNAGELNIDANVSIVATKCAAGEKFSHALYVVNNGNGGTVNFNGGLVNNDYGYAVRQCGDGNITLNGGEIKGTRAIWLQLPGSNTAAAPLVNLTVNDGVLRSTGESDDYKLAVYSYNYGNDVSNVNITVNGGVVDGDIALTGGTNKDSVENVVIYGGQLTDVYSYGDAAKAAESIVIYGGTFANDPSAFIAPKHFAAQENGVWIVKPLSIGAVVNINGVKAVVYSSANGVKAVSVEELNLNGKNWSDAVAWASGLGEGWDLATIYELDEIWKVRAILNNTLEADSEENALFCEEDYYTEGKYAIYLSSTDAVGNDSQGNAYYANRVHLKYFNLTGYWDYPYSTFSTINKSAPLKDNYFARAVYTLGEYAVGDIVEANGVKGVVYSVTNEATKVVSVEQGPEMTWNESIAWAENLGTGWSLASLTDMKAIYNVRFALNNVLAADNADNVLFEEDNKEEDGTYAAYWTSTLVEGSSNKAYYMCFDSKGRETTSFTMFPVEYSRAVYTL